MKIVRRFESCIVLTVSERNRLHTEYTFPLPRTPSIPNIGRNATRCSLADNPLLCLKAARFFHRPIQQDLYIPKRKVYVVSNNRTKIPSPTCHRTSVFIWSIFLAPRIVGSLEGNSLTMVPTRGSLGLLRTDLYRACVVFRDPCGVGRLTVLAYSRYSP